MSRTHSHAVARLPLLLCGVLCYGVAAAQEAESAWRYCPPPPPLFAAPLPSGELGEGETALEADEVVSQSNGESLLRGNVVVEHDGTTLQGDEARFNQAEKRVTVEGQMRFHGEGLSMSGEGAQLDLEQNSAEFQRVEFYLPEQHAFGSARQFSQQDADHATLKKVRYTTCPPGREDWLLSAGTLKLDQQSNTGEAYNTVFRLGRVPVFYSPYLNFPLAGRKSGLLFPEIGNSESSGSDVRLPLYWNIAPNYDATITPRYLSRRGAMVMGEFRFLTEQSEGQIQADYLPDDQLQGDDRSYLAVDTRSRFHNGWYSQLKLRDASDSLYLEELGDSNVSSASSHLERRLDVGYRDRLWHFLARTQSYQTLNGTAPYQRLPQLKLQGESERLPNRLHYTIDSELVRFAHEEQVVTGTRLDLKPGISLPLQGAAWYLHPSAAWRYTAYQLEDHPQGESFERSLPILSLDGGLFFEREATLFGTNAVQTLEPRLYYLHVPYEAQDTLPNFDTAVAPRNLSQLFRDNRFNGADRQGDANQLSAALTSRLLDERSGRERLRASIGRTLYLEDREVALGSGDPSGTTRYSDLFAELMVQPLEQLRFNLDLRYDTGKKAQEEVHGRVRYQSGLKRLLALDYHQDVANDLQQGSTLLFWPLARQWQLLGRWRYDLDQSDNLELLAGVEYESCCWSARLFGRQHRTTVNEAMDNSVYLTFGFKGLGSMGDRLEDFLDEGLLD